MESARKERDFGHTIKSLRRQKKLTVREFIQQLRRLGQDKISPAYITRIEVHGEIPSPDLICRMADVLDHDQQELLELAKKIKIGRFSRSLEEKYIEAVGMYRLATGNKAKDDKNGDIGAIEPPAE